MQIGQFAKICKTKISVLRHYDKVGLLVPDYVDKFTGYRYYSKDQINVFFQITALRKGGFSLSEIKSILKTVKNNGDILEFFERKKAEINKILQSLNEAEKIITEAKPIMKNQLMRLTANADYSEENFKTLCEAMEKSLIIEGYQRVGPYKDQSDADKGEIIAECEAVKLGDTISELWENTDLPFEDDPQIIGKWEIIGEFACKEDFYSGYSGKNFRLGKEIYFLPHGEKYWIYSWTKGKLLLKSGEYSSVNDYSTEFLDGGHYMFVSIKSYDFRRGGMPTVLVLRQEDNKEYSAKSIARRDNVDMPFEDDRKILGKWRAVGYCKSKEAFDPVTADCKDSYFFSEVEFKEKGELICKYDYGAREVSGSDIHLWTKGYILRFWNSTACAYETFNFEGKEYLLIEWKSGDYVWGGFDCSYYVFVRAS